MAEKSRERERPTFIEETRRKQIIESTILTLAERGFINTSLADIADNIGVTKGVISYHFDNKDELIDATLETIIQTQVGLRQTRIDEQISPVEKFKAYILANLEFLRVYPTYVPAMIELWANYSTPKAKDRFNHTAYEPARLQLGEIFLLGQEQGVFACFDHLTMASLIQGMIDGVTFQWSFNPGHLDLDKSFEEITDLFMKRMLAS